MRSLLGDDSIRELFDISDKVFLLAKRALLTEDFPVDPRVMDFYGVQGRANELKVAAKPHNKLLAVYIKDEIVLDLVTISNPLGERLSDRNLDVYHAHRDERYRAFIRKFYKRITRMRKSVVWKLYSKEERIQRQHEVFAEMKEQELGIKTDRSKSIGLNFVEFCKREP